MTDNKRIGFFYVGTVSSDLQTAAETIRVSNLNPTDLKTFIEDEHTTATDVIISDARYSQMCDNININWYPSGNFIGVAQCDVELANGRCGHGIARVHRQWLIDKGPIEDSLVACHEIGHVIGLEHRSLGNGCMESDTDNDAQFYYTPHDIDHFNSDWSIY